MSTKKTVETINNMASILEDYATLLRRDAAELQKSGDWSICGKVFNRVVYMNANLRLDLLVNRPIQALERQVHEIKEQQDNG